MSQTVSGTDTKWIPKWSSDGDERGFRIEYSLIELDSRQPWMDSMYPIPRSRSRFEIFFHAGKIDFGAALRPDK